MKTIRFLLAGCGTIGERHAFLASQKGIVQAVCDINEKKVKAFSGKHNCYGYTSLHAMLQNEQADVLVVCTPNGLHAAHSIAGLKAGLHVLCEKPMALAAADCKKMIAAAEKAKKHLLIVKQNRYNAPVTAVKELLQKNKLGKIYSVQVNCFWNRGAAYYRASSWRGTKEMDGGVLFTQFSHFIDLLYWFFGELQTTTGYMQNVAHSTVTEIEDTGVFAFVTKSGITGTLNYTTNTKNKNYEGSVTVFAENATIKIGGPYLNTVEYQEPVLIRSLEQRTQQVNQYKGYQGSMNNHEKVYSNFLQVIAGRKTKYVSGEEAFHSVRMIEQFYAAAKRNKKAHAGL
ncbi:MAG: Gfo/Idh/MocA family protein [Lacibacter sp.]